MGLYIVTVSTIRVADTWVAERGHR